MNVRGKWRLRGRWSRRWGRGLDERSVALEAARAELEGAHCSPTDVSCSVRPAVEQPASSGDDEFEFLLERAVDPDAAVDVRYGGRERGG